MLTVFLYVHFQSLQRSVFHCFLSDFIGCICLATFSTAFSLTQSLTYRGYFYITETVVMPRPSHRQSYEASYMLAWVYYPSA